MGNKELTSNSAVYQLLTKREKKMISPSLLIINKKLKKIKRAKRNKPHRLNKIHLANDPIIRQITQNYYKK